MEEVSLQEPLCHYQLIGNKLNCWGDSLETDRLAGSGTRTLFCKQTLSSDLGLAFQQAFAQSVEDSSN